MTQRIVWLLGIWFSVFYSLQAQQNNAQLLPTKYQKKYEQFLKKHPDTDNYIRIDAKGIYIYGNKNDKLNNRYAHLLEWENIEDFKKVCKVAPEVAKDVFLQKRVFAIPDSIKRFTPSPNKEKIDSLPLNNIRIALDPGHFAGDREVATMEGKKVIMSLPNGTKIEFYESVLAWGTAKLLEKQLREAGAEVMLTRSQADHTALNITFEQWYKRYVRKQTASGRAYLSRKQALWQVLKAEDFNARIQKMNAFQPDISIVIHYNVDANNTPWDKPVNHNFSMAFVGGAFDKGELDEPNRRFQLLRLLVTDDVENSTAFSQKVLEAHQKKLGVNPIGEPNTQFFLDKYCLFTGTKGVYSRNLSLTREVFGVLCYGESLLQDNIQEAQLLNQKDIVIGKWTLPYRVQEVADAYFEAILAYTKAQ